MSMQTTGIPNRPAAPGTGLDDEGYIMVALLIGMAVMAIWMSAALPAWRQQAVREKEAELIFRGEQYARAIFLYRQENGQAPPPNLDTLVNRRYLRKKYLDPMTGKDFVPVAGTSSTPAPGRGGAGVGRQGGGAQPQAGGGRGPQVLQGGFQQTTGITGVRSTSTEESIVLYQNQQVYNQFPFDWTFEAQRAGAMGPINVVPGGGNAVQGGGVVAPGRGGAGRATFGRGGAGRGARGARGGRGAAGSDRPQGGRGQFGGVQGRGNQ